MTYIETIDYHHTLIIQQRYGSYIRPVRFELKPTFIKSVHVIYHPRSEYVFQKSDIQTLNSDYEQVVSMFRQFPTTIQIDNFPFDKCELAILFDFAKANKTLLENNTTFQLLQEYICFVLDVMKKIKQLSGMEPNDKHFTGQEKTWLYNLYAEDYRYVYFFI